MLIFRGELLVSGGGILNSKTQAPQPPPLGSMFASADVMGT